MGTNGELDHQIHHNRHHHNTPLGLGTKHRHPKTKTPPRSRNSFLVPIQTLHYGLCPLTTGGNRSYGQNLFQGHKTNVKLVWGVFRKGTHSYPGELDTVFLEDENK